MKLGQSTVNPHSKESSLILWEWNWRVKQETFLECMLRQMAGSMMRLIKLSSKDEGRELHLIYCLVSVMLAVSLECTDSFKIHLDLYPWMYIWIILFINNGAIMVLTVHFWTTAPSFSLSSGKSQQPNVYAYSLMWHYLIHLSWRKPRVADINQSIHLLRARKSHHL